MISEEETLLIFDRDFQEFVAYNPELPVVALDKFKIGKVIAKKASALVGLIVVCELLQYELHGFLNLSCSIYLC